MKRVSVSAALAFIAAACSSGPPGPPPPPPFTPAGVFDVSFDAMGQKMYGTMTIEEMDGAHTGSLLTDVGTVALSEFTIDGTTVTFSGTFTEFALAFALAYEGEGFAGEIVIGDLGSGAITGVKR